MKAYFICLTFLTFYSHATEQPHQPREWDAHAYANGNSIQEYSALHFLQESKINLAEHTVLDMGCGTGNISWKMAQQAQSVHGFDASFNMINYAKQTYVHPNLTFEQAFAEHFTPTQLYSLVTSFFCITWIENKYAACEKINHALELGGEFLGTIVTQSDPTPFNVLVALEMIPLLQEADEFFKDKDILKGCDTYPTDEEFKTMLLNNGFEIVSYEGKTLDFLIKDKKHLESILRPIVTSLPVIQAMPNYYREFLLNFYLDLYLTKLKQNSAGEYILPAVYSKVFHAKKVREI